MGEGAAGRSRTKHFFVPDIPEEKNVTRIRMTDVIFSSACSSVNYGMRSLCSEWILPREHITNARGTHRRCRTCIRKVTG